MKNIFLLLTASLFLLIIFASCEKENLVTGAVVDDPTANLTATKCYLKEITTTEYDETYKYSLSYNTKNLPIASNEDGVPATYEYDANNRVTKLKQVNENDQLTEIYDYTYDAKGNMTSIKHSIEDRGVTFLVGEYQLTTNSSGQISKLSYKRDEGEIDFIFEYDKKNIKKLIMDADGEKLTLIENLTFDTKTNAFANTGLVKVNIPLVITGAIFGQNLTKFINTNNILTDKVVSSFGTDPVTTTYKYEYTKDDFPSKMTYLQAYGDYIYEGNSAFIYDCK